MKVAVVMGSKNDMSVVGKTLETLEKFGISFEARVISAHRSPEIAAEFAKTAEERGVDGLDSLLSTVQMPDGIPVATVAVNGAANAAILAAQILAVKYESIRKALKDYKFEMQQKVIQADEQLQAEAAK